MGKGSSQRPPAIPPDELAERWAKTFPPPPTGTPCHDPPSPEPPETRQKPV